MSHRRFALFVLAVALLALPLRTLATSVIAPDFSTLVKDADYVVHAVVKSVTSDWREYNGQRYIATKVELEVKEVIKGTPPSPLVLDLVGGRVGTDELVVEGTPKFLVGDEDILFVQGNGQQVYPLVGMMHGRYPLFSDAKTGEKLVLRSNGMPLYSEQDVSLPMTKLSAAKTQDPAAKPMSADNFIRKIRAAGTATRQAQEN
jgi:hypothetical protein